MSLNETVKSFLIHREHQSALGRAAQRVWVKHQLQAKGILNPENYNQPQMRVFYDAIVANYIHLHQAHPQTFDAKLVMDRGLLNLQAGQQITHADLYLTRVIEKARTIDFRELAERNVTGATFSTGMIIDDKKITEEDRTQAYAFRFFKTERYLDDPNCPKSFATIVSSSTQGLSGMLGYILESKESRDAFKSDPKGFMDRIIARDPRPLTPEQQQSYFAMQSPAFVNTIAKNEDYIASAIEAQAQHQVKEVTSHEGFHLGLLMANPYAQTEPLKESYARPDIIASHNQTEVQRQTAISQRPVSERIASMTSLYATQEIYTDILAARANHAPLTTNYTAQKDLGRAFVSNTQTVSAYSINEPIFGLLENMMIADNHSMAIQNLFSSVSQPDGSFEFFNHPIFTSPKSAFNIVGRGGRVHLPSTFKGSVKEPALYANISPCQTYFALTNNILTSRMIANEQGSKINSYQMIQQVQTMLLESFQNTVVSDLLATMESSVSKDIGRDALLQLFEQVSHTETITQQMFTNLLLSMDINTTPGSCKDTLTGLFGKDATFKSVMQSPKTIEEVKELIESGVIIPTDNLEAYMTTLASVQGMRETLETSLLTANPTITDEQWAALLEVIHPSDEKQIEELSHIVTLSEKNGGVVAEKEITDPLAVTLNPDLLTSISDSISTAVATENANASANVTEVETPATTEVLTDSAACDVASDCPSE